MMPAAQAVESLVNEYGKLVFQTIYGLTGDWEESQDLTQDTFHQALKTIDAARAKSGVQFHAKAWLLQIALNTVRMQRRRRSIFRFIPFSSLQKAEPSESETSSQQASTDTLIERAAPVQPTGYGAIAGIDPEVFVAEQDAVRRSLAHLSEPLRLCLLLSVIGQFSTREIAKMLEIEEAAVRQRLGRARKQFQSFYEHESGEEIVEKSEATNNTNMSQKHLPNHHSNIERAELRFPG
ncbi:MAG TPA: sigma-70 family RNA polymerase sigma factor [Ktedonobacteraceae bacterium]|jgi:RNA polymerase sigma factor (sigma-70 family)|nr:sigma-70 family RNA polymerase sigma factor [Ktedonobacteraceae bacterium]